MRIAVHSSTSNHGTVQAVVEEVREADAAGVAAYWAPMLSGVDTLTTLAVASVTAPTIDLCTAVVPIPVRTPFALAQQALTLQETSGGRLVLGLGTSHEALVKSVFHGEWEPPLATMRTYLDELIGLLEGDSSQRLQPRASRPPVVLGAMNPRMSALAAELTDGIVTWAAGLRTLEEVTLPAVAGRPVGKHFRLVAALPICVTDDVEGARAAIHRKFGMHDGLPSYQMVFAREGVSSTAEISLVGNETEVGAALDRFEALGVTEFAAHLVAKGDDRARTWAFLSARAAEAG